MAGSDVLQVAEQPLTFTRNLIHLEQEFCGVTGWGEPRPM
jgi:hypothetical protein